MELNRLDYSVMVNNRDRTIKEAKNEEVSSLA